MVFLAGVILAMAVMVREKIIKIVPMIMIVVMMTVVWNNVDLGKGLEDYKEDDSDDYGDEDDDDDENNDDDDSDDNGDDDDDDDDDHEDVTMMMMVMRMWPLNAFLFTANAVFTNCKAS